MNKSETIKILSTEQAIKIAAGEVIERPANIAKELIENSIDAQATHITIHLKKAGKELFSITDNGIGMSAADLNLCIQNHATSKISTVDDLETITTFGFRGEALASINAVSNLTLISKRAQDHVATKLEFQFGKKIKTEEVSHQTGTTVVIENLFDNIPARQKFLKQDETEYRAIVHIFKAFCLQYNNVHFQLYHNDQLQFNCPATTSKKERFAQLWDMSIYNQLIDIPMSTNQFCSLEGVMSNSTYQRYDRNQIFIFVNNRLVKNNDISKAILKSYLGILPNQKFPAASLHITVPSNTVDVNIHPKKEEVKFLYAHKIETFITQQLTKLLTQHTLPQMQKAAYTQPFTQPVFTRHTYQQFTSPQLFKPFFVPAPQTPLSTYHRPVENQSFEQDQSSKIIQKQTQENVQQAIHEADEIHISIIGQYAQTYIMIERPDGLMLIDQHAAHERILYEELKKNFNQIPTIQLMFPEVVKLNGLEIQCAYQYTDMLKQHGFTFESFSDDEILIQSVPVHTKNQNIKELIKQAITLLQETNTDDIQRFHELFHEKMHANLACKTAIKAGDTLNMEQMQTLIAKLIRTENRFCCPHGRPTSHLITLDEITKKFKRDYQGKNEKHFDNFL